MRWIVLMAFLLASSVCQAADKKGNFRIKGLGTESCQWYAEARSKKSPSYYLTRSWLNGYLTALNRFNTGVYDIAGDVNISMLSALLSNYCKGNPKQNLVTATAVLVQVITPATISVLPDVIEAKSESKSVKVSRETLKIAQDKLKKKGHYKGGIDGSFGPKTLAAFREFQRNSGLKETGLPDQRTLVKLLISKS